MWYMVGFTNCTSGDFSLEPRLLGNGSKMNNREQNIGGVFKQYE